MRINIFAGETRVKVAPHLYLSGSGSGSTGVMLTHAIIDQTHDIPHLHIGGNNRDFVTNRDLSKLIDEVIDDVETKIIFMPVAVCDFQPMVERTQRLETADGAFKLGITPADKIISKIRKNRKDIFLVSFKTTCGHTSEEMYNIGVKALKTSSSNLVLVNDYKSRMNMIVTPEESIIMETDDRETIIKELVDVTLNRAKNGGFTRTTLVEQDFVDPKFDDDFQTVLEVLIDEGYYTPNPKGVTTGHFAESYSKDIMLSSRRKTNYNHSIKPVKVTRKGEVVEANVLPSAGATTQMMLFDEIPSSKYIVHFHGHMNKGSNIKTGSQRNFECGSKSCGINTVNNVETIVEGALWAVHLDNHGPNIIWNDKMPPDAVIEFIMNNWDADNKLINKQEQ
jgi:hypothetical protein